MAHDVFISYATSDKAVADAVCSQLESIHRIRCWIAPRDVTPGASWAESIIDALDGSKIMVLIFSSNANASMQIEREVERAVHKGINIIPLRIENTVPTKTLEYFISSPHWLDAISVPLELHINKLATSVKALLSKHGQAAAKPVGTPVVAPVPAIPVPQVKPAAVASTSGERRNSWVVPASVAAALVLLAVAGLIWTQRAAPTVATQPAAAPVEPVAQPVSAPAAAAPVASVTPPSPTPAASIAAAAKPAPAPATTSAPAATGTAPGAEAAAATAAAVAAAPVRNPNLFLDFRNSLSEGSIAVDIDGQRRWSEKLGTVPGKPRSENLRTALNLPKGAHEVTVTILTPDERVRERKTTTVTVDPAMARTLRIRLSRFKRNLELQAVVGRPAPDEKAETTSEKPAANAKTKPATSAPAAGTKPVSAIAKPPAEKQPVVAVKPPAPAVKSPAPAAK